MKINLEDNEKNGRAYVSDVQAGGGEMTFSKAGDALIIIDHTEVSDELRGQGVGRKLFDKVIEKARAENWKVMPLCPYAASVFKKDKSVHDVLRR